MPQQVFDLSGNNPARALTVADPNTQTYRNRPEAGPVTLVVNSNLLGSKFVYGGTYIARFTATNWNGGSAKLQTRDADGVSFYDTSKSDGTTFSATANATQAFTVGNGSEVQAVVTGSPIGLYVSLSHA